MSRWDSITSEASNKVPLVKILYDFHLCFSKAVQRTGRVGSYMCFALDMLASERDMSTALTRYEPTALDMLATPTRLTKA